MRVLTAILITVLILPSIASTPLDPPSPGKLTSRALRAASATPSDLIVQASGYPDLRTASAIADKPSRTRFVFERLTAHAQSAQAALLRDLNARGLRATSLWISNQVWVRNATAADALWLARRRDVQQVDLDVTFQGTQVVRPLRGASAATRRTAASANGIEWGVQRVGAPLVWAQGYTGTGVVVADLDTGVQWNHPGLIRAYRGWDGAVASHDYNWFDAAGISVGAAYTYPFDDRGHGTHTVGTILGDDGLGNQVGVAPGARWIGCRNMLNNVGSVARYTACFQFALAPTDVNGNNPDPSKAADITSNSWGCFPPGIEVGCEVATALITVTQSLRDAGIFVIASAGNAGPNCGSVSSAPATLDQAFSIGATNSANQIAGFSSRGPSTLTGRVKPDIVAPGESVRSTVPGTPADPNQYGNSSGTSMAAPHVSGGVALLLNAAPELRGRVSEVESILRRTATPIQSSQDCANTPGAAHPNNVFGYGLLNIDAAVQDAWRLRNPPLVQTPPVIPNVTNTLTVSIALSNSYETISLTNRILTFTLPASTTVIAASPGVTNTGVIYTWYVPAIDPGQTVTREIVIQRLELQPVITHTALLPLMVRECGASTPCMLVPLGQGNR
jgi:subtilisin family serine protease